ncbi:hypothetical protein PILCRDRAFT_810639 [Piloderma croceum F 1598]|uniref:Nuclear condensin complex subunit 3 C-terminal domain-containing protein n=1 Tax=Piloderma croceum (strain F 1598) TaxID=765440 RepID=A0A0C3GLA2_PILCF|nr:hypothetical protein PILCRDRAFT_810639 [Piloderma croceum F 1598]
MSSVLDSLATSIPKAFEQAQISSANHQKNFVALHKLQADAAKHTESVNNGNSIKLTGERAFEDVFVDMVSRVLSVKKGASQADRIVRFVGSYTKFINEKVVEQRRNQTQDDDDDEDTPTSRFTARLIRFLLKGFVAKDKTVRYRVVHLVAEMVACLGEIDEDLYTLLRSSLLKRINDKEAPIRVQAVIALSKLCGSEDPDEVKDGEPTAIEVLIGVLGGDPSAEVRRAAILNMPLTPTTLSAVLSRTRDTDTTNRKLVYSAVLEPHCEAGSSGQDIGVGHPRALTIAQRELVVRNGLGDREEVVRSAAGSLVGAWVDVVGDGSNAKGKEKDKGAIEQDVVALLKLFDLAESNVVEDALLSVFKGRVDIFDALEFGDAFWADLTPERAFLARVFVAHCITTKDEARLELALPVVTALAFRIQEGYNALLEDIQAEEERVERDEVGTEEARQKREDERMDREFVIGEMLKLAVDLDYADEIGRRKMFQLVRDMIGQEALPENLVARCLDVLRILSPNERDLIRVVVEVVHELRDTSDPEEDITKDGSIRDETETNTDADNEGGTPAASVAPKAITARGFPKPVSAMTPEEKARADDIDLRCLSLCIGMLERVNGTFEENSTLEGILADLIIPAVKRKELALREKGLISLGLCCLIAKRMATNSFQLFLGQIQSAPEILKIRVLQIVFDILMVHEGEFLGKGSANGDRIIEFLLHVLDNTESEKVQALICMGLAKLMLAGMASEDRVLTSLIVSYLSPDTADNQELRQCLAYFFPVYCYSSPVNQRRMHKMFMPMFQQLSMAFKELEDDQDMVTPAQVGAIFVDWTDPQKAIDIHGQPADDMIHVDLASDIVKALYNQEMSKDDKKVLCQLLGKLYLPEKVDDDKLRTLKLLMHNLRSRRPLRDTTANNAFTRFDTALSKKYKQQLEDFNEDEYRQLEYLKDLFEFLDDIIPEDDEEEVVPKKKGTRKRRSGSLGTETTASSAAEDYSPANSVASSKQRNSKGKSKAKRRRLSTSDDDDETEQGTPPASVAPTRSLPKRAAAGKKKVILEAPSDESEEDDRESTPAPPSKNLAKKGGYRQKSREESKIDADIDDLLEADVTRDSIVDSEEEEDDVDEVNSILASDEEP